MIERPSKGRAIARNVISINIITGFKDLPIIAGRRLYPEIVHPEVIVAESTTLVVSIMTTRIMNMVCDSSQCSTAKMTIIGTPYLRGMDIKKVER